MILRSLNHHLDAFFYAVSLRTVKLNSIYSPRDNNFGLHKGILLSYNIMIFEDAEEIQILLCHLEIAKYRYFSTLMLHVTSEDTERPQTTQT
ncbi:hypothetical protein TWF694_006466 [Orbilia ellipsospora]|uniref:Uncharacterized protein n=1 Tax=Orbilia ellipsospora TaxID=2528407 RepID=A0AAV9XKA7_9PEZI